MPVDFTQPSLQIILRINLDGTVAVGIVSGFAATGINEAVKQIKQ